MSEFLPKKVDLDSINGGKLYKNGDGVQPQTINDVIGAVAFAQFLATNNSKEIFNIKSVLLGNEQYVELETKDEYASRITADNENIFDNQYAKLLKVEGNTARSKNLFNHNKITRMGVEAPDFTMDENGVLTVKHGWNCYIDLPAGTYTVSVEGATEKMSIAWLSTTKILESFPTSFSFELGEQTEILVTCAEPSVITRLQIEKGNVATKYTPYFDGLKSAMFSGIKSIGKKLFDDRELINKPLSEIVRMIPYRKPFYIPAGTYSVMVKLKNNDTAIPQVVSLHLLDAFGEFVKSILLGELPSGNGFNCAYSFTINEREANSVSFISLYVDNGKISNISNEEIEYIMLNLGDTIANNEPYIESAIMFPQPVELKEYDYLLFDEQKKVVKTKQHTFTGEEVFVEENTHQANWDSSVLVSFVMYAAQHQQYSNYSGKGVGNLPFLGNPQTPYVDIVANATENCFKVQNGCIYIVYLGTIDELKTWLRDRYVSGDPVVIAYETATVTEVPFTEEQIAVGNEYTAWKNGTEEVQGNANSSYGIYPTLTQLYLSKVGV